MKKGIPSTLIKRRSLFSLLMASLLWVGLHAARAEGADDLLGMVPTSGKWLEVGTETGGKNVNHVPMTLEEAKRLALERNLSVKSSEKELLRAKAEAESLYADFFPKLTAEGWYSRSGELQRIRIPAGTFGATPPFLPPTPAEFPTSDLVNYGVRLSLEQPLYAGGAIHYRYESAQLGSRLAGLGHQQTIQDLLLRVELTYWEILKMEQLQEVAKQQVFDLKAHLRLVEAFHDAGTISFNEILKTKVNLAEAEQRLLSAENQVSLAKMEMNHLLRRDITSPLLMAKPFFMSSAAPPSMVLPEKNEKGLPSYEEALETARRSRVELKVARGQIEEAGIRRKSAQSRYYPTLSAIVNYDRAKETATVLPENREVLLLLRWTFWEWGKTGREVEQARLRLLQSEDHLQALEDRIALEVGGAHLRTVEAGKKIAVTEKAIDHAKENERIVKKQFNAGAATNMELLDAESLLISARANHTHAVYDFQSAQARLVRAMGRQTPPEENSGHE